MYVNRTKICKLKANDNISCYNFYFGSISKDFTKDEQREISLNGAAYNFSFDHCSIKKEDILNIHKYLMVKNNVWIYCVIDTWWIFSNKMYAFK